MKKSFGLILITTVTLVGFSVVHAQTTLANFENFLATRAATVPENIAAQDISKEFKSLLAGERIPSVTNTTATQPPQNKRK